MAQVSAGNLDQRAVYCTVYILKTFFACHNYAVIVPVPQRLNTQKRQSEHFFWFRLIKSPVFSA